jgi:glycosyltransferase involved in cell wall biosynthesis
MPELNRISKPESLRLLIVAPLPPPYGGIGHGTKKILDELNERDEIKTIALNTSPRWRNVQQTGLILRSFGGGIQGIRDFCRFIKYLFNFRPDVLDVRSSGGLACFRDAIFIEIARRLGIPAIYSLHFGRIPELADKKNWEWKWLLRAVSRSWRIVVLDGLSRDVLNSRFGDETIILIPNSVDRKVPMVRKSCGIGLPKVLFLGWVIPTKGVRELMEAWNSLNKVDWELVIAGPVRSKYEEQLRKNLNPALSVTFTGELPHEKAMELLRSSELLVLPSHTEAFPYVVLEAMVHGKPVIGTSVGALPHLIEGRDGIGPCGVLVESRDVPGLRNAIRGLLDDEDRRREMGANGRMRVEREYSSNQIFEEWIGLWRQAAEERKRRHGKEGGDV